VHRSSAISTAWPGALGGFRFLTIVIACACLTLPCHAEEQQESGHEIAIPSSAYHLDIVRFWLFRSFLPDADDDANTLGLEFDSTWGWGSYNVTNISYIELADYPIGVPGLPIGNPEPGIEAKTGINDFLTAFLFSKQRAHHGPHHFAWGFSAQLPTGAGDTLSSGKYSIGPAIEYEYHTDRLYMAFVALQLWSVAGDSDRKDVNMMMIKPMITWDFSEKWKAVYMPYGISAYWNKPSGQQWYVPLGGGIQRQFNIGSKASAFSVQYFRNVVRPDDGVEHDFRLMLEINF
jgi:hypothetical protein